MKNYLFNVFGSSKNTYNKVSDVKLCIYVRVREETEGICVRVYVHIYCANK